jgi:hypothetical protein
MIMLLLGRLPPQSEPVRRPSRWTPWDEAGASRSSTSTANVFVDKVPMRFDATLPDGSTVSVDGFLTVDEKKLAELPDAKVLEFHKNGVLGLIHAHQISLRHMRRLVDWHLVRKQAAIAAA